MTTSKYIFGGLAMAAVIVAAMLFADDFDVAFSADKPMVEDATPAQSAAPSPEFVPTGIFYMNGLFVQLKQLSHPLHNLHECMEDLQKAVNDIQQAGKIPDGGAVIGACVPVPTLKVTSPIN